MLRCDPFNLFGGVEAEIPEQRSLRRVVILDPVREGFHNLELTHQSHSPFSLEITPARVSASIALAFVASSGSEFFTPLNCPSRRALSTSIAKIGLPLVLTILSMANLPRAHAKAKERLPRQLSSASDQAFRSF